MAKPKRIPAVFHPGIATSIFDSGRVISEAMNEVKDAPAEDSLQPVMIPKVSHRKANLRTAFNALIVRERARTNFERDRIPYYLPESLKDIFKAVTTAGGNVKFDEQGQKFLTFIETEIYGKLPSYNAEAKAEEANGFTLNGKNIDMNMSREVARRQIRKITSSVSGADLIRIAEVKLKDKWQNEFPPKDIHEAVRGSGSQGISRKLMANLVVIAAELK